MRHVSKMKFFKGQGSDFFEYLEQSPLNSRGYPIISKTVVLKNSPWMGMILGIWSRFQ
jgi:hypothetical protein